MKPSIPSLAGQTLGNWHLLRQLGAGTFGAVYEAQHQAIAQRRAAVKVLHPHLSTDAGVQRRFINEANAASQIEHQNIIQIYDGGVTESGVCYVVMELVPGQSLEDLLAKGRLEPARAVHLAVQIASALAAAHAAGIVHRDLKPGNLLISGRKENPEFVKILDFGIAKLQVDQKQTATGTVLGTPLYMPPEQWEGKADVDGRVDIYALGMILYECLTGAHPFVAKSAMQLMYAHTTKVVPDPGEIVPLPERLRRLVLGMVHKRPEDRPASMAAVESELRLVLAELAQRPPADGPGDAAAPLHAVAAGAPLPMAATLDPVLSLTAEVSTTGLGSLAGSLPPAAPPESDAKPAAAEPVRSSVGPAVPPARSGRLPTFLWSAGAALALGGALAAALTVGRGTSPARQAGVPLPRPIPTPPAHKGEPAPRLVELGPGRFVVGRPAAGSSADGPAYAVQVERFAIEAYEVSVAQLAAYAQATHQPGLLPPTAVAMGGTLPAVGLSRDQAMRYCAWRHPGGRLPTEAEWEYAARDGQSEQLYPWPGPAGTPAADRLAAVRANLGSPRPQLEPVDSRPAGATAHGVYNLLGNAAEWTLSDSTPYPGSRAIVARGLAVVRGGSALTPVHGLLATTRQFVPAGRSEPFLGFRCVVSGR